MRRSFLSRLVGILAPAALLTAVAASTTPGWAADLRVPSTYGSIGTALARAAIGDRVLIAPGTYLEHGLILPEGVALVGGGDDPADVVVNGQGAGRVLACENFTRPAEIRNLTITGGRADGETLRDASGGALLVNNAAVTVVDVVFRANSASRNGGAVWVFEASPTFTGCQFADNAAGGGGGGLDCTLYAAPSLQNCRFEANRADWGAGLSCRESSSPVVISTDFLGNTTVGARGYGGGAFCDLESQPMFFACTFTQNEARYGGAVANFAESGATLVRCTLVANRGLWRGAGIYSNNAATSVSASIVAFHEGPGLYSGGTYGPQVQQSNLFGNAGGDWIGPAASPDGGSTNRAADPLFCTGNAEGVIAFNLQESSPCHPDSNGGVTIGAWPAGCGAPLPATLVLNTQQADGRNRITWRLPEGLGIVPEFRLTGARTAAPEITWDIPYATLGNGEYVAEDATALLQGDGPFTFRLYAAFNGSDWTLLAQATLDGEQEVPGVSQVLAAPNPFNPATSVSFRLGRAQRVRVVVYDLDGRLVSRLADGEFQAGLNSVTWDGRANDGRALASGTYVIMIDSPGRQVATKVTLLK